MDLTEEYITGQLRGAGTDSADSYAEIEVMSDTLLRCAAVLVPLIHREGAWHLLFTRRAEKLLSHQGQVSFPGGACEADEATPEQTALREAEEEIGLRPADVRLLGRLNPMITISSYRVTPVVGVLAWPCVFRVHASEVARVFTIPLLWLADPGHRWEFPFPGQARSLIVYHPFDGELLWGATARMTVDFLNMLGFDSAPARL